MEPFVFQKPGNEQGERAEADPVNLQGFENQEQILRVSQGIGELIELVKGGPMTERAQILGQQVGIFALLLLMSFAFYNDIARLLS